MFKSNTIATAALTVLGASCFLVTTSFNAQANDSERISQLEKEVQEIKQRLSRLEGQPVSSSARTAPQPLAEGWKSLSNWRKLNNGMTYDEVRNLLGEPQRINGGEVAFWYYPNRGSVGFIQSKLNPWTEPR